MKLTKLFIAGMVIFLATSALALKGQQATEQDIKLLKQNLLEGKIKVGETRLSQIRAAYGDATNITSSQTRVVYDYGDLRIEFEKNKYFRDWDYDYSHETVYKDEIDDLRFDLEDGQVVGKFHSLADIIKDYKEPTEAYETEEDGEISVYYWGEVRLRFENSITVKSWQGQKLDIESSSGVLGAQSKGQVY